jgi:hypothetical protein
MPKNKKVIIADPAAHIYPMREPSGAPLSSLGEGFDDKNVE